MGGLFVLAADSADERWSSERPRGGVVVGRSLRRIVRPCEVCVGYRLGNAPSVPEFRPDEPSRWVKSLGDSQQES